jgi:glycosyltransferase involved in cell wall biosynthesis
MKILIATDAWQPQVNGVVRTLKTTVGELTRQGHEVRIVHPGEFLNFPCYVYPEIHLAMPGEMQVDDQISAFDPDAIHIATEGPIGYHARRFCLRKKFRFTTSYHTKFPEYLRTYFWLPLVLGYHFMKWFHRKSSRVMVATRSVERELRFWGFRNRMVRWSRGVDTDLFHPRARSFPVGHRPILLYVGRVSREKNVEAFLNLRTTGTKYVVGDGPQRSELEKRYPEAVFLGPLAGDKLAEAYANADVMVFPSKTDTFGLVILEALASGVPVAAYPAPGPMDILGVPGAGAMDEDLQVAVDRALAQRDPVACVAVARKYSWENCTRQFLDNLVVV